MEAILNECKWTQQEEEGEEWLTGCGRTFYLTADGPISCGMNYCFFCGKSIAEIAIVWNGERYVKDEPKISGNG